MKVRKNYNICFFIKTFDEEKSRIITFYKTRKNKNEGVMYKVLSLVGLTNTLTDAFIFLL